MTGSTRRGFFRLLGGALGIAATLGVPAAVLAPVRFRMGLKILVINSKRPAENGVYVLTAVDDSSSPWVLTRTASRERKTLSEWTEDQG